MQHDLFHVYTVDQHTLTVIRNLRRFTMPEHAQEYPFASQLISELDRHWLLYVAALFHDIAKGRGGDHSELGAREVRKFAHEHGLAPEDAELVEFLVRQHLLMSTVAQKRDLSDPEVVREFAATVKDERHLTALYLLTVADIRGTSPKVWNAWKGKLLEDLYRLTLGALGGAHHDADTVLNHRKAEAARLTPPGRPARRRARSLLERTGRGVLPAPRRVGYRLAYATPVPPAGAGTGGGQGAAHGTGRRPAGHGLYARCARPVRGHLRLFRRQVPEHPGRAHPYDTPRLGAGQLYRAAARWRQRPARAGGAGGARAGRPPEGSVNVFARRRGRGGALWPGAAVPHVAGIPGAPQAELQPDERSKSWRLSVTATDRPGLLHALARVFAGHGVNLQMAKVMTLGDRVEDVFIIEGETLERPRTQMQFERAILDALAGDGGQRAAA